jgi:CRISPR-associated protein Cas1
MKTIIHSKRANLYYLEHCRVLVNGGRVEYVTDEGKLSNYWNIPIANTTSIILGTGTSITQAAMRELAKAGVLVGFCGGGGTPLFSAMEQETDILWLMPQSEYRPVEYLQRWVKFWFDDSKRLDAAKYFQNARIMQIKMIWNENKLFKDEFMPKTEQVNKVLDHALVEIEKAADNANLLSCEARLTKQLFRIIAQTVNYGDFTRVKRGMGTDPANRFLDHGNYLAYGLGATAAWVLGLPHGLAVLHGKTRRGGLVFDIADLIKDSVILPQAFISAMCGDSEQEFRQKCIENMIKTESLDFMIDIIKDTADYIGAEK